MSIEQIIILAVFLGSLLLVNAIMLGIILSARKKVMQAQKWASTTGTVLASAVQARYSHDHQLVNYPVVLYSYQAGGQNLQGNKIVPGYEVGGAGAQKVVARYPVGAQVTVYYDPANPSDAVLERNSPSYIKWLTLALVLADLFLSGLGMFIWSTL